MSVPGYLIYACPGCGQRVFTESACAGLVAVCPLCQRRHYVGGEELLTAQPGIERRADPRQPAPPDAQVQVRDPKAERRRTQRLHAHGGLDAEAPTQQLHRLLDVSAVGLRFGLPAQSDRRHLAGKRAPLQVGAEVEITLHTRALFRPRRLRAVVRRLVEVPDGFEVGAEFVAPSPEDRAAIRELSGRRGLGP